jgi:hypothetical protein
VKQNNCIHAENVLASTTPVHSQCSTVVLSVMTQSLQEDVPVLCKHYIVLYVRPGPMSPAAAPPIILPNVNASELSAVDWRTQWVHSLLPCYSSPVFSHLHFTYSTTVFSLKLYFKINDFIHRCILIHVQKLTGYIHGLQHQGGFFSLTPCFYKLASVAYLITDVYKILPLIGVEYILQYSRNHLFSLELCLRKLRY